jgi:PAS domain S-box-containing protein
MSPDEPTPVNILLVDDRPENLAALKTILNRPEYRLVAVTSGKEALRAALREKFALILLDVVMPEMDGFEVARHLKEVEGSRYIPLLFLTAIATDVVHIYRAYSVGAVDYLIKPLDNEVVRRKVAVFVDLFRQRQEIERQAELLRAAERRAFDLRLAELRLATDRRYQKLVSGIDYAISWTTDRERRLTFISEQAPGVLGYTMEQFLEPDFWAKRIHPDDREAFMALARRALGAGEHTDLRLNHRMVAADGRVRWFHTGMAGTAYDGGEIHGVSVDVTDIKEAERTQALLAEVAGVLSESLDYRVTLPKVAKCIVPSFADVCLIDEVIDGSRRRELAVSHVDPAAEEWVRCEKGPSTLDPSAPVGIGHVVATRRADLHREVPDERWLAVALGLAPLADQTTGATSCMFIPLLTRERVLGVMTLLSCSRQRFAAADLAVAEEVGRRVALAMENTLLYEAAHRATRAREQLLAVVSHDLRNPLSATVIMAGQIEHGAARLKGGERLQKAARAILNSTSRMDRLIGDLMDFTQLEFGTLKVDRHPVRVKGIVERSLETEGPLAATKGLVLDAQVSEDLVVHCDRERVLQILSNLVGNAIKFTPRGGSVSVRAERDALEVQFSVSDTGPGIAEEELPKIWERFWRAKGATEEGVGLGLAIAKGLVEAQDGRIWVESKPRVGTTFYFTLPSAVGVVAEEIQH